MSRQSSFAPVLPVSLTLICGLTYPLFALSAFASVKCFRTASMEGSSRHFAASSVRSVRLQSESTSVTNAARLASRCETARSIIVAMRLSMSPSDFMPGASPASSSACFFFLSAAASSSVIGSAFSPSPPAGADILSAIQF